MPSSLPTRPQRIRHADGVYSSSNVLRFSPRGQYNQREIKRLETKITHQHEPPTTLPSIAPQFLSPIARTDSIGSDTDIDVDK